MHKQLSLYFGYLEELVMFFFSKFCFETPLYGLSDCVRVYSKTQNDFSLGINSMAQTANNKNKTLNI